MTHCRDLATRIRHFVGDGVQHQQKGKEGFVADCKTLCLQVIMHRKQCVVCIISGYTYMWVLKIDMVDED